MQWTAPVETHAGQVRELTIGSGEKALTMGGEDILPLHFFDEGSSPNPPGFALEVWDVEPKGWAEWVLEPFGDVVRDPVKWAQKCVDFGADLVCLKLMSTDPAGEDASPDEAASLTKRVAEAIAVPLIVYGSGDEKKDAQVLPRVAEICQGLNLLLGPVVKENHEEVGKAALLHGHRLIAQSPLDINLMKELNVRLCKFAPPERIVIDPLSSALGYGMEYTFTIMERTKQAGVVSRDAMTQMPIIADLGTECWKTKEAKESKEQGLAWEGITALSLLLAGANILVLRHPETLRVLKELISPEGIRDKG
ncbi:MAG: Corrinoid/iron-sulfur protein small subunit [Dehalococcoidia bacterium]|nr:Corrinoid/iron-sulfur protein small subunit [Chloroflexota bacterium]MBT9162942.1 Corrinoid/iron-sulfur protein small subunit [Chloroflexota bacterium]